MKELNNQIQLSHCSFEVSELLEKKGFKIFGDFFYTKEEVEEFKKSELINENEWLDQTCCPTHDVPENKQLLAPTHALAIEWIRLNFNIHISIMWQYKLSDVFWTYNTSTIGMSSVTTSEKLFTLPEEAMEAALKYTLENKIIAEE